MEVLSQLFVARGEEYISQAAFDDLAGQADVLAGKIVALTKSLGRKPRISSSGPRR